MTTYTPSSQVARKRGPYTPEERAIMAAEREAFGREVIEGICRDFLAMAEAKAEREKARGRWDDLKQLRLDGLRDILAEIGDLDLHTLAGLLHTHGLHAEFALVDREKGIRFTDTGIMEPDDAAVDAAPSSGPGIA